jgi:mutator protein MutT
MTSFDPNYFPTKAFAQIGQKAVIFNEKGEILLLLRSEKTGSGGKWSFAGGSLEDREDPIVGIQREISEETLLSIKDLRPYTVFSYTHTNGDFIVIIGYTCISKSTEVVLNWEHQEFKWVNVEEAKKMDLSDHARRLIEQLPKK